MKRGHPTKPDIDTKPPAKSVLCQVEECKACLNDLRDYHKRYKICEKHLKQESLLIGDKLQRFCQQCGRYHDLADFDGTRRSCRKRLEQHNRRRRQNNASSSPIQRRRRIEVEEPKTPRTESLRHRSPIFPPRHFGVKSSSSPGLPASETLHDFIVRCGFGRQGIPLYTGKLLPEPGG